VPPKRSSSCKALQNFSFPKPQHSVSEQNSPLHQQVPNNNIDITNSEKKLCSFNYAEESPKQYFEAPKKDLNSEPINNHNNILPFSNFRPRRNSIQKDGEPICLRSRSSSPQFWKSNSGTSITGPSSDCKTFWKKLEKCSMEDLSTRHTPSPIRPASVAFYPKTPEPVFQSKVAEIDSPRKKVNPILIINYRLIADGNVTTMSQVTFSNILLERNYLQMDLPDLSPGSKVDEEFNKIYNISRQEEQ